MRSVDTTGVPGQLVLAFRRLRRAPAFTLAAVLLLGVGMAFAAATSLSSPSPSAVGAIAPFVRTMRAATVSLKD